MLLAVKVKSTQTRGYVADEIGTLCMSSHSSGSIQKKHQGTGTFAINMRLMARPDGVRRTQ
jgi:hypothetical protein